MCGICGIYSNKVNQEISPNLQSAMLSAIQHRGPDDQGSLTEQNLFLGMRRLSIIDDRLKSIKNEVRASIIEKECSNSDSGFQKDQTSHHQYK